MLSRGVVAPCASRRGQKPFFPQSRTASAPRGEPRRPIFFFRVRALARSGPGDAARRAGFTQLRRDCHRGFGLRISKSEIGQATDCCTTKTRRAPRTEINSSIFSLRLRVLCVLVVTKRLEPRQHREHDGATKHDPASPAFFVARARARVLLGAHEPTRDRQTERLARKFSGETRSVRATGFF